MYGDSRVAIPGGFFHYFQEVFLRNYIPVNDVFFKFPPNQPGACPYLFSYGIYQYGTLDDEWVIEFRVHYDTDHLLKAFIVRGFLEEINDMFLEKILDVNEEYTTTCPRCYTHVTLEYSELYKVCPECGISIEERRPKDLPEPIRYMDRLPGNSSLNYCEYCEMATSENVCETCGAIYVSEFEKEQEICKEMYGDYEY